MAGIRPPLAVIEAEGGVVVGQAAQLDLALVAAVTVACSARSLAAAANDRRVDRVVVGALASSRLDSSQDLKGQPSSIGRVSLHTSPTPGSSQSVAKGPSRALELRFCHRSEKPRALWVLGCHGHRQCTDNAWSER
jgi:hypothetical protein